jgi:hypothetical protein
MIAASSELYLSTDLKMFINPSAASWAHTGPVLNPAIETFHRTLPDYGVTPLVNLPELAKELGVGHVLVKDESHRFGLPAFKILGASWAIYNAVAAKCNIELPASLEKLGAAARAQGVTLVTCTDGNWGRSTARMAKYLQIPAWIFVPKFTDQATQDKISSEGATVCVVDGDYDLSIQAARKYAEENNGLLVMDISWEGYEGIPQVRPLSSCYENSADFPCLDGGRGIQYDAHGNRPTTRRGRWQARYACYCLGWMWFLGTSGLCALQVEGPPFNRHSS